MKALLQIDGSLALTNASETRIIRPSHASFAALMRLYQLHATVALSAAHAPAGYTHAHPLVIRGEGYAGGEFIPSDVVAEATPLEKAEIKGQVRQDPNVPANGYQAEEEAEHQNPPGFGGHPWKGGTPEPGKVYHVPVEHINVEPEKFQYKKNADKETGVTRELDHEAFDPEKMGELSLWKDHEGKTNLVDGHHRFEMAQEAGLEHVPAKYIHAESAEEAKRIGAEINGHKDEGPVKSKGHVAFVGKHEYYRGKDGTLFKAKVSGKIVKATGNRNGDRSSEEALGKHQAKEAPPEPTPPSAGPSVRTPHTAPAVETTTPSAPAGGDEPGFTGEKKDKLDRLYHWKDGVRIPGPEEPVSPEESAEPEEITAQDWLAEPHELTKDKHAATHIFGDDEKGFDVHAKDETKHFDTHDEARAFADEEHDRHVAAASARTPKESHDENQLEETGGGGDQAGLPAGERLGGDAAPAPEAMLPESGEGTRQEPGAVPASPDVRGDAVRGEAGGPGDAEPGGGGTGAGAVAADAAGRDGVDQPGGPGIEPGQPGASSPATPAEQSLSAEATPDNPTDLAAGNFKYGDMDFAGIGLKTKFKQNVEAIKTLRDIELEGRATATPAEQAVMAKYVGWGQFPGIFKTYGDQGFELHEWQQWQKEAAILQALLSEGEWRAARGSILNAHYTHPDVVKLHWDIAQRLGFNGGRFLETSAGIGYYLGMMPGDLASRTHASAVELDQVTGKMLKLLYPSANVNAMGFEQFKIPNNFYDLVASNVPFGDYRVHDPDYNKHQANIHDYFFLKSVDKVRPGGLVMHITSAGTMDKGDSAIREELAKQCDLVSALRFPGGAHKENAGTDVVTDMLILRKRGPGEKASGPKWLSAVEVPCPTSKSDPDGGEPIPVNEYFRDHPEQILGRLDRTGTMYGGDEKNVTRTDDYEQRLAQAVERLPKGIMSRPPKSKAFEPEAMPAPGDVRPGGFAIKNGKLFRSEEGQLVEQKENAKNLARIQGMMGIRDATRAVINAQTSGQDATAARAKLNEVYDAFVKQHGFLNEQANKRAFRGDPDGPLMLALEKWNNEGKTAAKSDMFSKNTISRVESITHADTVGDALAASLHEHGHLNVEHMAKLLGQDEESVKKAMVAEGVAYEDPAEGFKPADLYLSGNVRRKLALARAAAAVDPKFQVNVDALAKVQPEDVDHTDIHARMGAAWIPGKDIADFAAHLLSGKAADFDIKYVAAAGEWQAHYTNEGARRIKDSEAARSVWGVQHDGAQAATFMDVLKSALSGRSITIKKSVGEGKDAREVVDQEATEACRAKVQEMKEAFCGENGDGWLWDDDARRERLHRFYNDNFNNIRNIEYNGAHLKFPGMNPAFQMRDAQKNFVWQIITTGKGLAAHEVGTGKTASMIAAAMELRRLGLAKKPAIACLKANIEAITSDVLKLYPGAKVLSTADMFSAEKRKKTISQIATGDYDIVLMTHDNLNMLPMRPETNAKYIQEELDDLRAAKMAMEDEERSAHSSGRRGGSGKKSPSAKALEKAEKKLEARLKEALSAEKKDDAVYFEDLGVDQVFVDEAHKYKTLPVYTKMDRVKGVPNGRSQRATNMLMRTRWLQEQNGGRGVVFATGTPVSNTMAELYTMQRYLQPEALKERGIDKFDQWANLFGDQQTKMEVNVAGQLKATTRFAKFVNIPELMQIARQVIDVRRADDMKKPDGSPAVVRPNRHDHVVVAPHSQAVKNLMDSLKERAEKIKKRSGPPVKGEDNMLVICTDGRKGALDMRLVDPKAKDDPESKTNLAIANILKISQDRPGQVQLIFSDVGVNPMKMKGGENADDDEDHDLDEPSDLEGDTDATGMRWYGDVIDKLVAGGIPREKIADFSRLHGQSKEDAQAALRRGDMLIGIGSTQKMGTGVNVQDKVTAMHHLDVPWVPADIEQRDGRGWRHGNQNKDVEVHRYVTEGSLDQMFWQVVGTKASFIKQVMTPGNRAPRAVENADTEQLSPEQLAAAASGDPRWMEKVNLEEDVKNLRRAQTRHDKDQIKLKKTEEGTAKRLEEYRQEAQEKAQDAKHLQENADFHFAIDDTAHTERDAAHEAFESAKKEADATVERDRYGYGAYTEKTIGHYRGLEVIRKGPAGGATISLRTPSGKEYKTSGSLQGIESIARQIQTKYHLEAEKDAQQAANDLEKIRANIGKTFGKGDELKAKHDRIKQIEAELAKERGGDEEKPAPGSMKLSAALIDPEASADVRSEALKALRKMFPLSLYDA